MQIHFDVKVEKPFLIAEASVCARHGYVGHAVFLCLLQKSIESLGAVFSELFALTVFSRPFGHHKVVRLVCIRQTMVIVDEKQIFAVVLRADVLKILLDVDRIFVFAFGFAYFLRRLFRDIALLRHNSRRLLRGSGFVCHRHLAGRLKNDFRAFLRRLRRGFANRNFRARSQKQCRYQQR